MPETSQQEKLGQSLEVSYHKWKTLARCKGTEVSVLWVRDTQVGAEGNHKDMDYKKLQILSESNFVKPTSGCANVARFGEAAMEAVKNFLQDNKVLD